MLRAGPITEALRCSEIGSAKAVLVVDARAVGAFDEIAFFLVEEAFLAMLVSVSKRPKISRFHSSPIDARTAP